MQLSYMKNMPCSSQRPVNFLVVMHCASAHYCARHVIKSNYFPSYYSDFFTNSATNRSYSFPLFSDPSFGQSVCLPFSAQCISSVSAFYSSNVTTFGTFIRLPFS